MKRIVKTVATGLFLAVLLTSIPLEAIAQGLEAGDDKKPVLDPFKVLIKPKKKKRPPVIHRPITRPSGPPPVPPLVLKVTAIAGEDPNFVAVIQYKGSDHIVEKSWQSPDKNFLVRNIYADKVEVFYSKDKSVKTFFF